MGDRSTAVNTAEVKQFARGVGGFAAATAASRVLGYLRDAGIAYVFGGGVFTDAYYAAFRITNFARRTIGEGAINAAVLPGIQREKAQGPGAHGFFSSALSGIGLIAGFLSVAGIIFAVPLVYITAGGFASDSALLARTARLVRILFPQLIFISVSAVFQSALYAERQFFVPALIPLAFSVSVIGYLALLKAGLVSFSPEAAISGLAWAAAAGSFLQMAFTVWGARRYGYKMRFAAPWKNENAGRALSACGPALFVSAGDQISMFLGMIFASFLAAGSVTAIYNSARIVQLPLGLFGVAAANVALVQLSCCAAERRTEDFKRALNSALRLVGFVLIPAVAGTAVLGKDIVRALFEHGNFTPAQSGITATALFYAAFGLPAHGINKLAAAAFYARGNWATPLKLAAAQTGAEAVLCLLLIKNMGIGGLTLASALGAWFYCGLLLSALRKECGALGLSGAFRSYIKFAMAAVLMAAVCAAAKAGLCGRPPVLITGVCVAAGMAVYALAAKLAGFEELDTVLTAFHLRRRERQK